MSKDPDDNVIDFEAIDEVQSAVDVLTVYDNWHKTKVPRGKGAARQNALMEWAKNPANSKDFLKTMVKDAREKVTKAKMGHKTEEEVLHERKAIASLQLILREELDKCSTGLADSSTSSPLSYPVSS